MTKRSNDGPIPQARAELQYIIDRLPGVGYQLITGDAGIGAAELRSRLEECIIKMRRRPPVRVSRAKRPQPTTQDCAQMRHFASLNPDATQMDIAVRFNTNPGRVSEALNFLR